MKIQILLVTNTCIKQSSCCHYSGSEPTHILFGDDKNNLTISTYMHSIANTDCFSEKRCLVQKFEVLLLQVRVDAAIQDACLPL